MIKPMATGKTDEVFTPLYAINPLIPYLKRDWIIFECAYGQGHLASALKNCGYGVVGDPNIDFLKTGVLGFELCDCIITNPPFSKKTNFLKACVNSGKPFALLLPLTALEGKERNRIYREHEIQLIIPDKRIHFIMTATRENQKSSAWFQTAWFTHGLNLPKQLNFVIGDW